MTGSFNNMEHNMIIEMLSNGYTRNEIALKLNRTLNSIDSYMTRKKLNKQNTFHKSKPEPIVEPNSSKKVSMQSNGNMVFEGIIELLNGEPITPDIIMKAHNLDENKWNVISFTSNAWQSQIKGGNKITLWQSKITVREKEKSEITFNDIDNYFSNKKNFLARKPILPFPYNNSKEVLEIDYTDAHTGLLAWRMETGADFDLNIIEQRFKECIADTVERCKTRKFKKIIFATLGDILHIDNDKNETTAGTLQQADGRMAKIFNKAVDMMIDCVDTLLKLKTPIEYVYVSGNHDRNTGYSLAKTLQMAYRYNKNIVFNITPNPQKALMVGVNLVGFCHGDMPKKNLGEWLQQNHRKKYGESKFAEVHCGHLHSESTKENCGVLIKHLPSICESSYWEYSNGYKASRGTMCFVWNEETGLRETWYNYI